MTKHIQPRTLALATAITLALAGCQTTDPYTGEQKTSNTTKGAGIGATGGAIAGAIFGGSRKEVFLALKEIGIDFAQGYCIAKPILFVKMLEQSGGEILNLYS
jgi:hypothetical protein